MLFLGIGGERTILNLKDFAISLTRGQHIRSEIGKDGFDSTVCGPVALCNNFNGIYHV